MQKLIAPSGKEIRNKEFPTFRGQILRKGFSLTSRPAREFSNVPASPALCATYLQKSIEGIDKKIFKAENDPRILLDGIINFTRHFWVMGTSISDLNINIDIFYNLLQKKFQNADIINLPDL